MHLRIKIVKQRISHVAAQQPEYKILPLVLHYAFAFLLYESSWK